MSAKKVTRRQAAGQLIRVTLFTAAIPQFLLAQTTTPQKGGAAGKEGDTARGPAPRNPPPLAGERVVIAGAGSALTFTIIGPPGRYCRVVYATADTERYRLAQGGKGIIGPDGRLTLTVDVRRLGSQQLLFRVGTSSSPAFDKGVLGTVPFEVGLKNGAVSQLPSKREVGATGVCQLSVSTGG